MGITENSKNAEHAVQGVRYQLEARGISYVTLPHSVFGPGVGVSWGETEFVVLVAAPSDDVTFVEVSAGVLRGVPQEQRWTILDAANSATKDNPAFPVVLHEAQAGADVLVQLRLLTTHAQDDGWYLHTMLRSAAAIAVDVRAQLRGLGVRGDEHRWTDEHLDQLRLRSVM